VAFVSALFFLWLAIEIVVNWLGPAGKSMPSTPDSSLRAAMAGMVSPVSGVQRHTKLVDGAT
jgi:multidrug resistance efflux pump